jgi:hypothetical protein
MRTYKATRKGSYIILEGETDKEQYKMQVGWTVIGNQEPYFSITGETWELGKARIDRNSLGCGALTLGDYIPELAHLDKWHLVSKESGPMHYVANTLYHASNRDHNGLLKGEKRQIKNGRTGRPCWELVAIDNDGKEVSIYNLPRYVDAEVCPVLQMRFEYRPLCRVGEGKEPDLEAARRSAVWPDATLEDFTKEKLEARLPGFMESFKREVNGFMESIG